MLALVMDVIAFCRLIQSYTERIKFCLAGSKRSFGLIKGSSVAVLVDASDVNSGFGRLTTFKESLLVSRVLAYKR